MMTRREGLLLASRAFALYLLCWGLSEVSYLPQRIVLLRHHTSVLTSPTWSLSTYDVVGLSFHMVRIVALFATASWLCRGGKGVETFLLPTDTPPASGAPANE
jgi:hypothetical protein